MPCLSATKLSWFPLCINWPSSNPGKPAQNAYIERFNRTFREAVLDVDWFMSLLEAKEIAEDWMEDYNTMRPHEALRGLTPYQYEGIKP